MFLYQGSYLHKGKETLLLTLCRANFGLTATSLFEIWAPAWSFTGTFSSLFGPIFFFSFVFFTKDFLPLLIIQRTKIFL